MPPRQIAGRAFTGGALAKALDHRGVRHQFGAFSRKGYIALIVRCWRSFKGEPAPALGDLLRAR